MKTKIRAFATVGAIGWCLAATAGGANPVPPTRAPRPQCTAKSVPRAPNAPVGPRIFVNDVGYALIEPKAYATKIVSLGELRQRLLILPASAWTDGCSLVVNPQAIRDARSDPLINQNERALDAVLRELGLDGASFSA